jgi:hypothetical protein
VRLEVYTQKFEKISHYSHSFLIRITVSSGSAGIDCWGQLGETDGSTTGADFQ